MSARRRRRGPPRTFRTLSASEALGQVMDRYQLRGDARQQEALRGWPAIVGEQIAKRAVPQGIRGGVLTIVVSNASWLHQLEVLEDEIVARLNDAAGGDEPIVRGVRLQLARGRGAPQPRVRRSYPRRSPPAPATGANAATIERDSERVDDPELRAIIERTRKRWDV